MVLRDAARFIVLGNVGDNQDTANRGGSGALYLCNRVTPRLVHSQLTYPGTRARLLLREFICVKKPRVRVSRLPPVFLNR